jgi:hypothetical protein
MITWTGEAKTLHNDNCKVTIESKRGRQKLDFTVKDKSMIGRNYIWRRSAYYNRDFTEEYSTLGCILSEDKTSFNLGYLHTYLDSDEAYFKFRTTEQTCYKQPYISLSHSPWMNVWEDTFIENWPDFEVTYVDLGGCVEYTVHISNLANWAFTEIRFGVFLSDELGVPLIQGDPDIIRPLEFMYIGTDPNGECQVLYQPVSHEQQDRHHRAYYYALHFTYDFDNLPSYLYFDKIVDYTGNIDISVPIRGTIDPTAVIAFRCITLQFVRGGNGNVTSGLQLGYWIGETSIKEQLWNHVNLQFDPYNYANAILHFVYADDYQSRDIENFDIWYDTINYERTLQFAKDRPIIIDKGNNYEMFSPIIYSDCKMNIISKGIDKDLIPLYPNEAEVNVYINNALIWRGYLSDNVVSLPYNDIYTQVTIQAVDCLSLAKELKFIKHNNYAYDLIAEIDGVDIIAQDPFILPTYLPISSPEGYNVLSSINAVGQSMRYDDKDISVATDILSLNKWNNVKYYSITKNAVITVDVDDIPVSSTPYAICGIFATTNELPDYMLYTDMPLYVTKQFWVGYKDGYIVAKWPDGTSSKLPASNVTTITYGKYYGDEQEEEITNEDGNVIEVHNRYILQTNNDSTTTATVEPLTWLDPYSTSKVFINIAESHTGHDYGNKYHTVISNYKSNETNFNIYDAVDDDLSNETFYLYGCNIDIKQPLIKGISSNWRKTLYDNMMPVPGKFGIKSIKIEDLDNGELTTICNFYPLQRKLDNSLFFYDTKDERYRQADERFYYATQAVANSLQYFNQPGTLDAILLPYKCYYDDSKNEYSDIDEILSDMLKYFNMYAYTQGGTVVISKNLIDTSKHDRIYINVNSITSNSEVMTDIPFGSEVELSSGMQTFNGGKSNIGASDCTLTYTPIYNKISLTVPSDDIKGFDLRDIVSDRYYMSNSASYDNDTERTIQIWNTNKAFKVHRLTPNIKCHSYKIRNRMMDVEEDYDTTIQSLTETTLLDFCNNHMFAMVASYGKQSDNPDNNYKQPQYNGQYNVGTDALFISGTKWAVPLFSFHPMADIVIFDNDYIVDSSKLIVNADVIFGDQDNIIPVDNGPHSTVYDKPLVNNFNIVVVLEYIDINGVHKYYNGSTWQAEYIVTTLKLNPNNSDVSGNYVVNFLNQSFTIYNNVHPEYGYDKSGYMINMPQEEIGFYGKIIMHIMNPTLSGHGSCGSYCITNLTCDLITTKSYSDTDNTISTSNVNYGKTLDIDTSKFATDVRYKDNEGSCGYVSSSGIYKLRNIKYGTVAPSPLEYISILSNQLYYRSPKEQINITLQNKNEGQFVKTYTHIGDYAYNINTNKHYLIYGAKYDILGDLVTIKGTTL